MTRRGFWLAGAAGASLVLIAGQAALGQNEAPESLLPPGFDQPTPAPAEPTPSPEPRRSPTPSTEGQATPSVPDGEGAAAGPEEKADEPASLFDDPLAEIESLPPSARRSLNLIGPLAAANGGFKADSLGRANGRYLATLLRNTRGELVSRWGALLLQRALISRLETPAGINGADWAAERASLLLRAGAVDPARRLVQDVDGPNFTPRLFDVAMQVYQASADPAGLCPVLPFAPDSARSPEWQMMRAICAALAGEQSSASEQIDRANNRAIADRIDLLLAEKLVGAGINGRRAVTIDWDGVERMTRWRFGMALAVGVEPPARLYEGADWRYLAWRARAPMLSPASRAEGASVAAAMGLFSSSQLRDLYGAVYDDPATPDALRDRAALLRRAYVAADGDDRIAAMRQLWDEDDAASARLAAQVLTADAAARIPALADFEDDSGDLIAAMLTAGLDRSAERWAPVVPEGSLGWALLAVAKPGQGQAVTESALDAFVDDDSSTESRKSQFLVAGLAGLGRLSDADRQAFEERLGMSLGGQTRWTRAMNQAIERRSAGRVALLAAVGMQGRSWEQMTPRHLFWIVRSLRRVGLEAEARMIAAEAVSRG